METGVAPDGKELVHPLSAADLRAWLTAHHARRTGVWLASFKKQSGRPRLEYDEIVEELLCFGWIDSRSNGLDEERSLLWISPRKPKSGWSRTNKERVAKLEREGRLEAPGIAVIEDAKRSGTWTSLDSVEALEVPADLAEALAENAVAARHFDAFPPGSRKIILQWIASAKRAETRSARIAETIRLAAENVRANHWRQ